MNSYNGNEVALVLTPTKHASSSTANASTPRKSYGQVVSMLEHARQSLKLLYAWADTSEAPGATSPLAVIVGSEV